MYCVGCQVRHPEQLGDGNCNPRRGYNTAACGYDSQGDGDGDCCNNDVPRKYCRNPESVFYYKRCSDCDDKDCEELGEDWRNYLGDKVCQNGRGERGPTKFNFACEKFNFDDGDCLCPATCHGRTCNEWLELDPFIDCHTLQARYDCDCGGCSLCQERGCTNKKLDCDYLIDNWVENGENIGPRIGCGYLQLQGISDCNGCACLSQALPHPLFADIVEKSSCKPTCKGKTCNYWVSVGQTCADLRDKYKCDCSGCSRCPQKPVKVRCEANGCLQGNCESMSTEMTLFNSQGGPWTCEKMVSINGCDCTGYSTVGDLCKCVAESATGNCPRSCAIGSSILTCDEIIDDAPKLFLNSHRQTCGSLENEYGCDCSGCQCARASACPDSCHGFSCDVWLHYNAGDGRDKGLATCKDLETEHGCDCSGCICDSDVVPKTARCEKSRDCEVGYYCAETPHESMSFTIRDCYPCTDEHNKKCTDYGW